MKIWPFRWRTATAWCPGGYLPSFEDICKAAGGHGERVEDPAALPGVLERAMSIVKNERRQALLNVTCGAGGTA
jgi:thiamine pyrophosphate-dependent acetolactate synthase large subunit-like protein